MMVEQTHYSLLDEQLITVRGGDGQRTHMTLPEVLAALSADDIVSFEALQPHQKQAWFCFLVQLAAIALARNGRADPPHESQAWKELLLSLTEGQPEPWCLVAEDVAKPAFMQPPVPEGSLEEAGYKSDVDTPDELDLLVTSRNHDLKMHRIDAPQPEHWLYALVALQTLEGFLGRGNYGIVRMNGGFASRPMVGMSPDLGWGARFRRDAQVLISVRDRLVADHGYATEGHALLWLPPWDGQKSSGLPLYECDPLFIEVCRRIRLDVYGSAIRCRRANTKGTRISAPDELAGVTGDPWTPVDKGEAKALSIGASGFSYDRIQSILLSGEYQRPAALEPTDREKQGGYLIATGLARGQGKTDGFHHRVVLVPPKAARLFRSESEREKLARLAAQRVELAADVQRQVLYPALRALLSAGSDQNVDSEKVRPWTAAFDADVDDVFFEELWQAIEMSPDEARRWWEKRLRDFARSRFDQAIDSTPIPSVRRYRAVSAAEARFRSGARKILTHLFSTSDEEEEHERAANA